MKRYLQIGTEVGELVEKKNAAYGSSFAKAGEFLQLLYPNGILPEQFSDALLLVRIFDKQMRIATHRDALGESPYRDIAGYGILGASLHENSNPRLGEEIADAGEVPAPVSTPVVHPAREKHQGPVLRQRVLHEGLSGKEGTKASRTLPALRKKGKAARAAS